MSRPRIWKMSLVGLLVAAVSWVAWVQTKDAGVVVSLGTGALYAVLWTLGLPKREWVGLTEIGRRIGTHKEDLVYLNSRCRVQSCPEGGSAARHIHFCECLEIHSTARLSRMYGFLKLGETFLRDVRYQWLFGVLSAVIATLIFVTLAKGSGNSAGSFDPWKAAIAAVVWLSHLATTAYGLVWFRKRAEEFGPITASVATEDSLE